MTGGNVGGSNAAPRGDLYILCVGVDGHYPETVSDINAQDALYVRQALVAAESYYDHVHSRILLGTRATRGAVLDALTWLRKTSRAQDVVVLFFACHGNATPKGYLIHLAKAADHAEEVAGIWGAELNAVLNEVKAQPIVLLDSCYSGLLVPGNRADTRAALIVSCEANAISAGQVERADRPSGFFVIALCEALSGLADADHDRVVTLKEVQDYLPARAQAFFQLQRAMVVRQTAAESIPLAQVNRSLSPQHLWTPRRWRNPFGLPDVPDPDGADVHRFAAEHTLLDGGRDPNAAPWPRQATAASDGIDGEWDSRWSKKNGGGTWSAGKAQVKAIGDRVYILYEEEGGRKHFIDAARVGDDRLVGRYIDLIVRSDSTPWVGRIVNRERIDGQWGEGRWDLRRRFAP